MKDILVNFNCQQRNAKQYLRDSLQKFEQHHQCSVQVHVRCDWLRSYILLKNVKAEMMTFYNS